MKKFIIILLACLMAFAFVSCEDEPEQEVIENLSMADASRISVVASAILNGCNSSENLSTMTDNYSEYVITKMPITSGTDVVAYLTGTEKFDYISDTAEIKVDNYDSTTGTDYKDIVIELVDISGSLSVKKITKSGKVLSSATDAEYSEIKELCTTVYKSMSISNYTKFANEYCKGFSKNTYKTTTETDCYSNGLVSRGVDNKVYVGKLSEGATFTKITRNDKEKTRSGDLLGTPDSEFILEAKLNGEDFNFSFSTVDNIAVINGKKYHATINQFKIYDN